MQTEFPELGGACRDHSQQRGGGGVHQPDTISEGRTHFDGTCKPQTSQCHPTDSASCHEPRPHQVAFIWNVTDRGGADPDPLNPPSCHSLFHCVCMQVWRSASENQTLLRHGWSQVSMRQQVRRTQCSGRDSKWSLIGQMCTKTYTQLAGS